MVKRIFQGVVVFFAIYSFVFVPLGKKTALEHVRAIFGTPAAREAAEEVKGGVTRLVRRLESEARQSTEKVDRRLRDGEAERGAPAEARGPGDGELPEEGAGHDELAAPEPSRAEAVAAPPPASRPRATSAEAPAQAKR